MCNLYDIGPKRHRDHDEWESALAEAIGQAAKSFGIRKTDPALVMRLDRASPTAQTMRWGFERPFNPAINNARSDKLNGMWSDSWGEKRRCLIPMSTFYEWTGPTGQKQTFAFEPTQDRTWLWAAGLWETHDGQYTCSMVTTDASESVAKIHHRMPALLQPRDFEEYLTAVDPRHLLSPSTEPIEIYRCENPLKDPDSHAGPLRQNLLPGFEGLD